MSLDTSASALLNAKRARATTRLLYDGKVDATAYTSSAQAVAIASSNTQAIYKYNNS